MKKSTFQFKGYKVKRSLFEISDDSDSKLDIDIKPSGVVYKSEGKFELNLLVSIKSEDGNLNIEVEFLGKFTFKHDDDNLPSFLATNAPALLFPYVRAYISTITVLSGGNGAIILPTLNVQRLKDELIEKTIYID